jgi:sedoheptulose-bisphosphatase
MRKCQCFVTRGLTSHALLQVEKAGGQSSCDGLNVSGLDVMVNEIDQRTQICYGSIGEVARFEKVMYGESKRFAEVAAAL